MNINYKFTSYTAFYKEGAALIPFYVFILPNDGWKVFYAFVFIYLLKGFERRNQNGHSIWKAVLINSNQDWEHS